MSAARGGRPKRDEETTLVPGPATCPTCRSPIYRHLSDNGVVEAVRDLYQEYDTEAQLLRDLGPGVYESLLDRVRRGQRLSRESYIMLDAAVTELRAKETARQSAGTVRRIHLQPGGRPVIRF